MKNKTVIATILGVSLLFLCSCASTSETAFSSEKITNSTTSSVETTKARELILDGELWTSEFIAEFGGTTSWYCMNQNPSLGDEILFEFGFFNDYDGIGFILFDGTNQGIRENVVHYRDGLEHRWDWIENWNDKGKYSFVIYPDGTGAYYWFFWEGQESAKPSSLYRTRKR